MAHSHKRACAFHRSVNCTKVQKGKEPTMKSITVRISQNVPSEKWNESVAKAVKKAGYTFEESAKGIKINFGDVAFNLPEVSEMKSDEVAALVEAQQRVNVRAQYVSEKLSEFGIETAGGATFTRLVDNLMKAGIPEETAKEIARASLAK